MTTLTHTVKYIKTTTPLPQNSKLTLPIATPQILIGNNYFWDLILSDDFYYKQLPGHHMIHTSIGIIITKHPLILPEAFSYSCSSNESAATNPADHGELTGLVALFWDIESAESVELGQTPELPTPTITYKVDHECANANRPGDSSLVLYEAHVSVYDKNTMEILEVYTSTIYSSGYETKPYYSGFSWYWKDDVEHDTDKHGFMISFVFIRIGADRVNDNPVAFEARNFQKVVSEKGFKTAGTGFDFSEMYYKSPIRPFFHLDINADEFML
ncbi:hypothetical protein Aduo_009224 [Ancylostoma duodenale]